MSKTRNSSHRSNLEAVFGVSESRNPDLFQEEDHIQFGTSFKAKKSKPDPQYARLMKEFPSRKTPETLDFSASELYKGQKVLKDEIYGEKTEENKGIKTGTKKISIEKQKKGASEDIENFEKGINDKKIQDKKLKGKALKKNGSQKQSPEEFERKENIEDREEQIYSEVNKPKIKVKTLKSNNIPKKNGSIKEKIKPIKEELGHIMGETTVKKGNIDDFLKEIEEEDLKAEANQTGNLESSASKSQAVKYQLDLWRLILGLRLQMQPLLDLTKRYPKTQHLTAKNLENQLILSLFLENLTQIQGLLLKSSGFQEEIPIVPPFFRAIAGEFKTETDSRIDCEAIYNEVDGMYKGFFPWAEKTLCSWSEKTQLLSTNLNKTGLKGLMHTPIGQVSKMMENIDKLQLKSQLKRGTFRLLFEGLEGLEREYDEEIYDDGDLVQELVRGSLEQKGETNEENMLFESTRQYLAERRLKTEAKKGKNVDRRASKNRKLRFEAHAKLINFMQREDRGEAEGREEIVKAIKRRFEAGDGEGEGQVRKKVKGGEGMDGVRLI